MLLRGMRTTKTGVQAYALIGITMRRGDALLSCMTALTAPESSAPADVSPGGSALNSTAPRHDARVARTYGHLRECRQQHAVRADKDLARSGSDLHKWEFPHLLQLPWLNWQERELMNREQPARSTPRLGFPSCAVAAWRGGQPAFGVARPMTLPRRAGLYMPRTDSRGG